MLTNLVLACLLSSQPIPAEAPFGAYVEARSAAVYAGACHYGAQYTTQGREGIVAWSFEGGSFDGVPLVGNSVIAILIGDKNLAEKDVKTSSILLFDEHTSEAARNAILGWLEATQTSFLGKVHAVRVAQSEVRVAGESFFVRATDRTAEGERQVGLEGALLPERECCVMPYDRWYQPFSAVTGSIVGRTDTFRLVEPTLKRRWLRSEENNAFVARFGEAAKVASATR